MIHVSLLSASSTVCRAESLSNVFICIALGNVLSFKSIWSEQPTGGGPVIIPCNKSEDKFLNFVFFF